MGESIVVTVRSGKFERDYELPCKVLLKELCPRLLEALKKESPAEFGRWYGITITCGRRALRAEETLESAGIRTGSILEVRGE